jgi:glycosyltransferase involved in cell wall biosynthesis
VKVLADVVLNGLERSLGLADAIHANSRSNAKSWEAKINKPIQVIPPVLELPDQANADKSSPRGLVVGRLQNWKGAEVLCQALEEISDIEVDWVGGDTLWEDSQQMASEYLLEKYPAVFGIKLKWGGRVSHEAVLQKMSSAAFLIAPSTWDVFNMTVAEAIAMGVPVICSRKAGAEMMIEDGVTGFLFDPERPADLAKKLKEVAALSAYQREAMICKAKDYLKKTLDSDIIIHLLEKSYTETLAAERQVEPDLWLSKFLELDFDLKNALPKSFPHRVASKIRRLIAATRP